ncbi:MAG: hypothetical protein ABW138_09785, partial [Candidatus Thiodiazotropha sp. 4PDIVS1]
MGKATLRQRCSLFILTIGEVRQATPFIRIYLSEYPFIVAFQSSRYCFAPLGESLFFFAKRKVTKRKGARMP